MATEAKDPRTKPLCYGDANAADYASPLACFGEITGSAGELGRGKLTILSVTTGSSDLKVETSGETSPDGKNSAGTDFKEYNVSCGYETVTTH